MHCHILVVLGTNLKTFDTKENVTILSFGVDHSHKNQHSLYIENFDDPFKFIAHTLSINDKKIYVIISDNKDHTAIPVIHEHYCVEKIYILGYISPNFEKITGCYSHLNEIYEDIIIDITKAEETQLDYSRACDNFTMAHTQLLENQYSVMKASVVCDECIIILYLSDQRISNFDQKSVSVDEFTDTDECIRAINTRTQSQVFFVIVDAINQSQIQSIFDLPQIYRIYFFSTADIKCSGNRKVAGLFAVQEDLIKQLYEDLSFYQQQYTHTSRIDIFPTIEYSQRMISRLDDQQIAFLRYKLFMDILPQMPLLTFDLDELTTICSTLFPTVDENTTHCINQLQESVADIMNYTEDPRFSQILLRLHKLDKLNGLFMMQKSLSDIKRRISQSNATTETVTVYASKLISNETLGRMKCGSGALISIGIFTLATKSLLTARTIARKMVKNGLVSVLFQIDVIQGTRRLKIDSNRTIHDLDAVFCLQSFDLAPDDVWYARVTSADTNYQYVKEQIQFAVGAPLSWLTFGNYLHFLNRPEEGKDYFDYLLKKLHNEYLALSFPCDEGAFAHQTTIHENQNVTSLMANMHRSTILSSIADVYYQMESYEEALNYYEQALESSMDLCSCSYYQQKILTVKGKLQRN